MASATMNPWPIAPLTPKDLNFAVKDYRFSELTAETLGELPGIETAIDSLLGDFASSIAQQTLEIPDIFTGLEDLGSIIGEIDSSPLDGVLGELANTATAADATLSDYQGMLVGNTSDASAPSTDCSQRTNQYGISKTGSFPGVTCNWQLTFQIFRVQDGPCTYSAAPAALEGDSHLPNINSFTLQSGDAAVWRLAHHTAQASDGTPFDVIDVTVTPKAQGHFDGVGLLTMNGGSRTWHVCMSVDFIP